MEAQTDLQTFLEQGRKALATGHGRESAIAYAHGAQLEPENPAVHLGLAQANLALGNYGVVQMACRKVFELQPDGGLESKLAQALLDTLERQYERALKIVDEVVQKDPGNAYVHALRGYLLRATGQDYDGNQARARAMRLSYGGRFENCFPALEPPPEKPAEPATQPERGYNGNASSQQSESDREKVKAWSRPNGMQRNMIRARFFMSQNPGMATNVLIGINVIAFLLISLNQDIAISIAQFIPLVLQGEVWRLVTGIFLYTQLFSIALGMLALFFIGRAVEIFYGPVRFLAIYLLSGICGGLVPLIFSLQMGLGPSGAFMGIFGAWGAFYIANRRALGIYGTNAIVNWGFWLILNLALTASQNINYLYSSIAVLAFSMGLSLLIMPRSGNRNITF